MSKQKSIHAVIRAAESKELDALQARKQVDAVVEQRKVLVDKLSLQIAELELKLKKAAQEDRYSALFKGKAGVLSSLEAFRDRLEREIRLLKTSLLDKQSDLQKAIERAEIAEQELVEARVEKKKAEHLLTNMKEAEAVLKQAEEEAKADDYNIFRTK